MTPSTWASMVGSPEGRVHQTYQRSDESLGLQEWEVEHGPQDQRGHDRQDGIPALAPREGTWGRVPCGARLLVGCRPTKEQDRRDALAASSWAKPCTNALLRGTVPCQEHGCLQRLGADGEAVYGPLSLVRWAWGKAFSVLESDRGRAGVGWGGRTRAPDLPGTHLADDGSTRPDHPCGSGDFPIPTVRQRMATAQATGHIHATRPTARCCPGRACRSPLTSPPTPTC